VSACFTDFGSFYKSDIKTLIILEKKSKKSEKKEKKIEELEAKSQIS